MEKTGVGLRSKNNPQRTLRSPTISAVLLLMGGAIRYGGKEICSARFKAKMILLEKLDQTCLPAAVSLYLPHAAVT